MNGEFTCFAKRRRWQRRLDKHIFDTIMHSGVESEGERECVNEMHWRVPFHWFWHSGEHEMQIAAITHSAYTPVTHTHTGTTRTKTKLCAAYEERHYSTHEILITKCIGANCVCVWNSEMKHTERIALFQLDLLLGHCIWLFCWVGRGVLNWRNAIETRRKSTGVKEKILIGN